MPATRPSRYRVDLSAVARISPDAGWPFVADLVPRRCRAELADRGKAHPGVTRRSLAIATLGGGPGTVPLAAIIEPGHYCHTWLGVGRVPVHLCHPSRLYRLESEPAPSPHLEPESGNQPGHRPRGFC